MGADLRKAIRRRADNCCEYCRLPEAYSFLSPFQVEHIIPRKHGGQTVFSNLALACDRCNLHKGTNLTGIDPLTRKVVRLFHPRRMKWARHFRWNGALLHGRTATGRATIAVLNINDNERVQARQALIEEGVFRP